MIQKGFLPYMERRGSKETAKRIIGLRTSISTPPQYSYTLESEKQYSKAVSSLESFRGPFLWIGPLPSRIPSCAADCRINS